MVLVGTRRSISSRTARYLEPPPPPSFLIAILRKSCFASASPRLIRTQRGLSIRKNTPLYFVERRPLCYCCPEPVLANDCCSHDINAAKRLSKRFSYGPSTQSMQTTPMMTFGTTEINVSMRQLYPGLLQSRPCSISTTTLYYRANPLQRVVWSLVWQCILSSLTGREASASRAP